MTYLPQIASMYNVHQRALKRSSACLDVFGRNSPEITSCVVVQMRCRVVYEHVLVMSER